MKNNHTVKRAIIMAAGIGKRMQPLTFHTPKPLIKVNGIRIIDTIVNSLKKNKINEIHVVIGYHKEQFYNWAKDIPNIHLIENPYYNTCNNISSLYMAREFIEDCIMIDGDQIIYNPSILEPTFSLSGYNAIWCNNKTNEWLMDIKNGIVKKCYRNGGSSGWQLYSISRWTTDDGKKLKKHLEIEFESGNTQIYWDDIVMFNHFSEYTLGIKEMKKNDIIEIDTLTELIQIDNSYKNIT